MFHDVNDSIPVTPEDRVSLFWGTCLPMRYFFLACILIASYQSRGVQCLFAFYLGGWGLGMLGNFITSEFAEYNSTAWLRTSYGNFGGVVWWQWPRLLHGLLLITFSITAFFRYKWSYLFAFADVLVALFSAIIYYLAVSMISTVEAISYILLYAILPILSISVLICYPQILSSPLAERFKLFLCKFRSQEVCSRGHEAECTNLTPAKNPSLNKSAPKYLGTIGNNKF